MTTIDGDKADIRYPMPVLPNESHGCPCCGTYCGSCVVCLIELRRIGYRDVGPCPCGHGRLMVREDNDE